MNEAYGGAGWITPNDQFYPTGNWSHSAWAWNFRQMVAETGVRFPARLEDVRPWELELDMAKRGWIRKASTDSYYLSPTNRQRAIDYALMYTKETKIQLDYINGDDEQVVLDRPESVRSIVSRLLSLLG